MPAMKHDRPAPESAEAKVFDESLVAACAGLGFILTDRQRELMFGHFRLLVEANRHFNLTRITSPADAAVKHYADSLTLLAAPWIDRDRALSVLDVGTGGGFPAVPVAIVCPQWHILAIDGTGKKVRFVAESAEALGLSNIEARHCRAGELACSGGKPFDLILVRAVGKIAEVLRETKQLVSSGTSVVFYKSDRIEATEISAGDEQAMRLGLSPAETTVFEVPSSDGPLRRRLIRFAKP